MSNMFRQGDVFFRQVNALPEGVVQVERDVRGRAVFALGEVTGHAHAVETATGDIFTNPKDGKRWYLATEDSVVVHEEHKSIILRAGTIWAIGIKRQLNLATRSSMQVYD